MSNPLPACEESLVSEFNSLLASQMTAQRRYYEVQDLEDMVPCAALLERAYHTSRKGVRKGPRCAR
eukprot:1287045-Amphidinium_carterae.1